MLICVFPETSDCNTLLSWPQVGQICLIAPSNKRDLCIEQALIIALGSAHGNFRLLCRRDGSLLVDHAQIMPTPDELILQEEFGHKEERQEDIADPDDDIDDPIDAMEDDFDEPDVPAVDLA